MILAPKTIRSKGTPHFRSSEIQPRRSARSNAPAPSAHAPTHPLSWPELLSSDWFFSIVLSKRWRRPLKKASLSDLLRFSWGWHSYAFALRGPRMLFSIALLHDAARFRGAVYGSGRFRRTSHNRNSLKGSVNHHDPSRPWAFTTYSLTLATIINNLSTNTSDLLWSHPIPWSAVTFQGIFLNSALGSTTIYCGWKFSMH